MLRIFGPPGTGKTTTLLNMVDEALATGVPPSRIAFLAFTRKAATEAKERALARFSLDAKKDLFYFRTLHSLALSVSDINADQIMQPSHYKSLGNEIGVAFEGSGTSNDPDKSAAEAKKNDPVLSLISLARLKKVPLRDEYNMSNLSTSWSEVSYISRNLSEFKKAFDLYDFTDMLEEFVESGYQRCPEFELTFLDEGQDLCPLQWDMAHMLDERSKKMYCAGDDDQAIYRWAGADVDHFIGLPGGSEVLSQSYRIPAEVHGIAERVANRINKRFPKEYKPKKERGGFQRISGYEVGSLPMDKGSWLILAQAAYMLNPIKTELKANGLLFNSFGHRSISEKISSAILGWERLRNGKEVSGSMVKDVYSLMTSKDRIKKGFKKLSSLEDDTMVTIAVLQEKYGLLVGQDVPWFDALDRIPAQDTAYITALLRRGTKLNAEPKITLSTIHGAKGGEADNVVLLTDLSPAAFGQFQKDPDDTHRLFYVGVTRTREILYIVSPQSFSRSYVI